MDGGMWRDECSPQLAITGEFSRIVSLSWGNQKASLVNKPQGQVTDRDFWDCLLRGHKAFSHWRGIRSICSVNHLNKWCGWTRLMNESGIHSMNLTASSRKKLRCTQVCVCSQHKERTRRQLCERNARRHPRRAHSCSRKGNYCTPGATVFPSKHDETPTTVVWDPWQWKCLIQGWGTCRSEFMPLGCVQSIIP